MIEAIEAIKRDLREAEDVLGKAHASAAQVRDDAPSGSEARSSARFIADRIERALQQLERINH